MDCSLIKINSISCCSGPSSPRSRVKFTCSHGGRILLHSADSHLKYVGGETRIISVPPDIPFQELMKKITYLIDGGTILKYQLVSEDLDALVSVKSDEDLRHMFNEINHYEIKGTQKLRAFLFPANPPIFEKHSTIPDPQQKYIDAINGLVRSPRYADISTTDATNNEAMQKLRSLANLNSPRQNVHQFPPKNQRQIHQSSKQSIVVRSDPSSPRNGPSTESWLAMRSVPSSPRGRAEGSFTMRPVPSNPAIAIQR